MRRLLVLTVLLCTAFATVAVAKTKHGITPTSPKPGATVPTGSTPTFKGKFNGRGVIYVYVSKKKKRNKEGVIGHGEFIRQAKKKGGRFSVKPTKYTFPEYFLNSPGTYYWQAHRIACEEGNTSDCLQEGPVVKFKVG